MVKPTTTYARRHKVRNREDFKLNTSNIDNVEKENINDDYSEGRDNDPELGPSGTSRKRTTNRRPNPSHPEVNLRKKQKLTKEGTSPSMSIQLFQTPFPTLQAQSQVFRLPSSTPQPSPDGDGYGPLSPLPIQVVNVPNSKNMKENQDRKPGNKDNNRSWYTETVKSSKMPSSMTLTSGAFHSSQESRRSRRHDSRLESRSRSTSRPSRSSSNPNSSRMSASSTTHKSNFNSILKHAQSLSSLQTDVKPSKKKQKQKLGESGSNPKRSATKSLGAGTGEDFPLLASPFASRACSPMGYGDDNAHISTKIRPKSTNQRLHGQNQHAMGPPPLLDARKPQSSGSGMRRALSDTFFNPNLPSNTGKSQSADASPQTLSRAWNLKDLSRSRTKTKTKSISKIDNRKPTFDERERRPSAPSRLHPPRPQRQIPVRPWLDNGEDVPQEKMKVRLASGLDIVVGPKTRLTARAGKVMKSAAARVAQKEKADPEVAMEWMHVRGAVDFNRPPSQMSIRGGGIAFGFGHMHGEVEAGEVFSSSEEDEDDNEKDEGKENKKPAQAPAPTRDRHRRISSLDLDAGLEEEFSMAFGDDALVESTPFKAAVDQDLWSQSLNTKKQRNPGANQREENLSDMDSNVVDAKIKNQKAERPYSPLRRTHSLPSLRRNQISLAVLSSSSPFSLDARPGISANPSATSNRLDMEVEDEDDDNEDEEEGEEGEVDMELTFNANGTSMNVAIRPLESEEADLHGEADEGHDKEDMTPWITDSIISPPTAYLEWNMAEKGGAQVGLNGNAGGDRVGQGYGEKEEEHSTSPVHQQTRLSSPFRLSDGRTSSSYYNTSSDRDIGPSSAFASQRADSEEHDRTQDQHGNDTSNVRGGNESSSNLEICDKPPANTKRTRGGTIVLAGAPMPPGARRTRGGTIVGPLPPAAAPTLPLPSIPLASGSGNSDARPGPRVSLGSTRTRSGTIVASSESGSGTLTAGGRMRSGSVSRLNGKLCGVQDDGIAKQNEYNNGGRNNANRYPDIGERKPNDLEAQNPEDTNPVLDIDYYVDSLYLPRLSSSPDPIDFLQFASIVEEEEQLGPIRLDHVSASAIPSKDLAWCVANQPPSPEITKKKVGLFSGRGIGVMGWRLAAKGAAGALRGKGKKKARFLGHVQDEGREEEIVKLGEEDMSDDELQLLPGSTMSLWA